MAIERNNPAGIGPLGSVSEVVRAGDTVYVAGHGPFGPGGEVLGIGDADVQASLAFKGVADALASVGSGMHSVVKVSIYVTRPEYFGAVVRAREEYLPVLSSGARSAASTTVVIPAHVGSNVLVEVDAIGSVGTTAATLQPINPPEIQQTSGHPQGARAGNVVYTTGQMARDYGKMVGPCDVGVQAEMSYRHMENVLHAAGATKNDVVRHLTYFTHFRYYEGAVTAQAEFYGDHAPACTSMCVWSVGPDPVGVIEVEATAVIGGEKRYLNPPTLMTPIDGSSQVVVADGIAYIAVQAAMDPSGNVVGKGDIDAQLDQVYQNLDAALGAAGGSRSSMVRTTTYMARPDYFPNVRKAREAFYAGAPPTSTDFAVLGLPNPDCLVAIEGIAAIE